MIIQLFYCLMLTVYIHGYRGPTFRSSIMEGSKPILRMPPENSAEQIENSPEELSAKKPIWMEKLRSTIKELVGTLGHKYAKPHITKLVEDTEDNNNVLLHVEVFRDGSCNIKYKPLMRAMPQGVPLPYPWESTWTHPIVTPEPDPQWLTDLKAFIKELIGRYGKRRLDQFITPVIKSIQKQHNIIVKDIDVDDYGEVYINHTKSRHAARRGKSSSKKKKQRESSAESNKSDSEDFPRVTEMPMRK